MNARAIQCPAGYETCLHPEIPFVSGTDRNGQFRCGYVGACSRSYCYPHLQYPNGLPEGMSPQEVLKQCGIS